MSLGFPELFFIALFALIVIGPKDLPRLASTAGRWWAELQRMKNEAMRTLTAEVRTLDSESTDGVTTSKGSLILEDRLKNVAEASGLELDQQMRRLNEDSDAQPPAVDPRPRTSRPSQDHQCNSDRGAQERAFPEDCLL